MVVVTRCSSAQSTAVMLPIHNLCVYGFLPRCVFKAISLIKNKTNIKAIQCRGELQLAES